jgi:GT2 family glycosyltransferase
MEEIDLCWRMKNLGYTIQVEPRSVVYHLGAGTLKKQSTKKTFLNFRNSLCCLLKNEQVLKLIYKLPLRLILDGVAGIKFLFNGQALHTFAILRGHLSFYFMLPTLLKKRKQIKTSASFRHTQSGIYKGSIVFDHYILGCKTFTELKRGFFSKS